VADGGRRKAGRLGDAVALPIVLTWGVAQLFVIAAALPTVVWIAPGLVAAVLSLVVGRRRESIVYLWVAAMFFILYLLTGDRPA
jgi:hypothetical protein